jgi:tetratricopeptide (TPR) repeat protein
MNTTLRLGLLLLAGLLARPSCAQTYQPKDDAAFLASKRNFHFVGDDQPLRDADFDGVVVPSRAPIVPASPHPIEVAESERAYDDGKYADAVSLLAEAASLEPADPTVLYCYARALYRGPGTREQSYPAYKRLVALLDAYGRESPQAVAVYLMFWEAYFKLATLQLDRQQWATASYNLSRAAAALQSMQEVRDDNPGVREQILQYQTECFAHLRQPAVCRYFGRRTLHFFPKNRYVLPYLAALPKAKASPRR